MADTIFAQATPRGRAGLAVIRISGPEAFSAVEALTGRRPFGRAAALRRLRHPETGEVLDEAMVLGFSGPGSFTGEDVAELQVHGSPAVYRSVLGALAGVPGLRQAEAGEFTRRALTNGRLDLAQIEGLAGLIEAETAVQQRQAMQLMLGHLSRQAADWRTRLVRSLAFVEASIDFADEQLPDDLVERVCADLVEIEADMGRALAGSRMSERLCDGFEVALVGAPNVGKSTLLNALAGRDVALTSEVAGTTRDVIEVRMDLDGLPVTLLDLAGMREATEAIESLGIARARTRAERADLRIFLVEDAAEAPVPGVTRCEGDLTVLAKADLLEASDGLAVSGRSGKGIERLLAAVAAQLGERASTATGVSTARQREAIGRAREGVARATACLQHEAGPEVAAADLQGALRALDFLVGRVDVEAVLDVIFRSFCLGK